MIRWAASRPAVVWATCIVIVLGGIVSFTRLALATRTTVELPRLQISSAWTGASAELMEMYVSSPIESAIQGVRGVRKTRSSSNEGLATITAELDPRTDVQIARLSILERLEILVPEFPRGVTRPTVRNFVPTELQEPTLFTLTVTGPYTSGALQKLADDILTPRLSAVSGVAGVNPFGGTDFSVTVSYDAKLLRQLGVSPIAFGNAVREARLIQSVGEEQRGVNEFEVTIRDQPDAIEQLADLPVRGRGGRVFRLGELATVRPEEDANGRFNRINGQPAITIDITRQPSADAVKTAAALRAALDEIRPTLPPGVGLRIVNDESEELAKQLNNLLLRGAIAFAAVILVIAVMLRDVRAVALVMGSAAVAIAGTAFGLYVFDIPANMLTLAGLAMGIGILVQDGVVVTERLGTVPDTREARAEAAVRIMPAVLGATLTTVVVLLPFLYLQGNARAAFMPFAAAFTMALGWSVLSSLIMIPALAKGHRIHESIWPRSRRVYARMLMPLIRFRWTTIAITALMLVGLTWVFIKKVPRFAFGGFGFGERTYVTAVIGFPRGSDPVTLDAAMREMEAIAVGQRGVEQVRAQTFGASAMMRVLFTREDELSAIPLEMEERLTQRAVFIGGASVSVRGQGPGFSSGYGSSSMASYRIRVLGYSFSGVEQMAMDLQERLERIPRVRNVDISTAAGYSREKAVGVTILPDRAALSRFGLTSADFSAAVSREIRGSVGAQLLEIAGDEIPVNVKSLGANTRSLDQLREALIATPDGGAVPLGSVSSVAERDLLSAIDREDQQYMRTVAYEFRGPNRLAQRTHDAFMKSIAPPAGYKVEEAGFGFFNPDDSEKGLWLVFAIGVTLVILAVALVFDSIWATSIIFLSLPIALGGVILAFWVMKAAFTREAAVGVILVIGLAIHQAILVTDAGLQRRRRRMEAGAVKIGLGPKEALRSALDRAGMVILITLTSMASLIPLAVGTSTQDIFGAIALATAGGTIFGTLGAMFVVPALLVGRQKRRRRSPMDVRGDFVEAT